ncbi:MAG: hypothetical protein AAEJ59_04885 [Arenicellales bacterium]
MTVLKINLHLSTTTAVLSNRSKAVKVSHCIYEVLRTWGELCKRSSALPGDTPLQSPLDYLATRGNATQQGTLNNPTLSFAQLRVMAVGVVSSTDLPVWANSLQGTGLSRHVCQFGDAGLDTINRNR